MPNYVNNQLAVVGPADVLKAFREAVNDDWHVIGCDNRFGPEEYDAASHDGWRLDTTSPADEWRGSLGGDDFVVFSFETNWTPPREQIKKLIEDHATLSFCLTWQDEGRQITGKVGGSQGIVITESEGFQPPLEVQVLKDARQLIHLAKHPYWNRTPIETTRNNPKEESND